MKTLEQVNTLYAETQQKLAQLRQKLTEMQHLEEEAKNKYTAAQNKNIPIIKKGKKISEKKTDWFFGLIVVLITAGVVYLLMQTSFMSESKSVWLKYQADEKIGLVNIAFVVLSVACGWAFASSKKLAAKILFVFWLASAAVVFSVNIMLVLCVIISYFVILRILKFIRRILFKKGKYNNIFHLLYPHKKRLRKAETELAELESEKNKAAQNTKQIASQIKELEHSVSVMDMNKKGFDLYYDACKTAEDYPASAVKAYNKFVDAYTMIGETGSEFFDLRTRMENEDGEKLYEFALEFCATGGNPYEFLRLLQLSVNKGCGKARSALGGAMTQISAAAGAGNYETAYNILQPLIEAGSTDALNIKLQLDNNQIAEKARLSAEKARKQEMIEAAKRNAQLTSAQLSVLNELSAMRKSQDFAQQMMFFALEDARRSGIKVQLKY